MSQVHLHQELAASSERVVVKTQYGPVRGRRTANGAVAFLELPYALPPGRFQDPEPLPPDFCYEDKEYISESSYCAQPTNDGQSNAGPFEDKVGLGKPTENPLFVNIVCPPQAPPQTGFPVKIYIHGGFLQFGSPHGLSGQAQYASAERSEVWVNIGYRLSVFGYLACDEPKVNGNFGFKDQWLALLWIYDNIKAFGGDPNNVTLTGLSAGAHSVHQILHHVSRLSSGEQAPFQTAILQSNSIVATPKTPAELRPQFHALCRALQLDPDSPDVLATLRDPTKISSSQLTQAIETDAVGVEYGTFRGCLDDSWLAASPDPMAWQRGGDFARSLKAKGVRSIVVGELSEEWYLYAIAHPVHSMRDIEQNMERYYQTDIVKKMLKHYRTLPDGASDEEVMKLLGEIVSDGQVYLPVRILARDLLAADFPVVRYQIRWTPEQVRPLGYVTHATDRAFWALRLPILEPDQADIARQWLDTIDVEIKYAEANGNQRGLREVLALKEDKTIGWVEDDRWNAVMRLCEALPGES
ncbi:carboxylesterase [Wolfiporia cocos MD-104 SS10]|uniref:Carboxylic ester hydrolase n=1 Tax=Wolfiporia cocos (strain MD-104) TaxID=742152 RepID=A0A2H3JG34_WOLCO|nr:carboxylesterase [Wolfiporia cocos MD-104 SS10]